MKQLLTIVVISLLLIFVTPPLSAQEQEFEFDPVIKEELKIEQENIRIELERIKQEIQRIIQEIAVSMKEEQAALKLELEALKAQTDSIRQQIVEVLRSGKEEFAAQNEIIRVEMVQIKQEAEALKQEITQIMVQQKEEWKNSTREMKTALNDSKADAEQAKLDIRGVLNNSRDAAQQVQSEQRQTLEKSKSEMAAALNDAKASATNTLQRNIFEARRAKEEALVAMNVTQSTMKNSLDRSKQEVSSANERDRQTRETERATHERELQRSRQDARAAQKRSRAQLQLVKKKSKEIQKSHRTKVKPRPVKPRIKGPARVTRPGGPPVRLAKAVTPKRRPKARGPAPGVRKPVKKKIQPSKLRKLKRGIKASPDQETAESTERVTVQESVALDRKLPEAVTAGKTPTTGSTGPRKKEPTRSLQERLLRLQKLEEEEKQREELSAREQERKLAGIDNEIMKKHQEKLNGYSDRIKQLKDGLLHENRDSAKLLVSLGNVYLESQQYLDSLSPEQLVELVKAASQSKIILGGREMSIWAFKLALSKKADPETHVLISNVYDEMGDGLSAARHMQNAKELYVRSGQQSKALEADRQLKALVSKYSPELDQFALLGSPDLHAHSKSRSSGHTKNTEIVAHSRKTG